jgi:Rieske Fe-S protein
VRPDPLAEGDYLTVYPSVGTVDYTAGTVVVNSKFTPTSSSTAFPIILTVEPQSTNIFIKDNAVLRINSTYLDSVQVTVTTEDESSVTSLIR